MKSSTLLLAFSLIILASCTSAYKSGQTPDDVYFSPSPPQDEYVSAKKNDDRQKYNGEDYYDDRYLRMKIRNRTQWSELNDWYSYDRYSIYSYHSSSYYWNTHWNPYTYWNYYYNPYCTHNIIVNPKSITYNRPRTFNLNTFNNTFLSNSNTINPKVSRSTRSNTRVFTNTSNKDNNSGLGNTLRSIFNNSGSSGNNKSSSSSTSSSSGSSGSSGKSSSAPVRKF